MPKNTSGVNSAPIEENKPSITTKRTPASFEHLGKFLVSSNQAESITDEKWWDALAEYPIIKSRVKKVIAHAEFYSTGNISQVLLSATTNLECS